MNIHLVPKTFEPSKFRLSKTPYKYQGKYGAVYELYYDNEKIERRFIVPVADKIVFVVYNKTSGFGETVINVNTFILKDEKSFKATWIVEAMKSPESDYTVLKLS